MNRRHDFLDNFEPYPEPLDRGWPWWAWLGFWLTVAAMVGATLWLNAASVISL